MEEASISTFVSSQDVHLSVGGERLPRLDLFYFEGASYVARENYQPSEDFLLYKYEDECFSFVVCDGVQQSTDASQASRLLGLSLLEILPIAQGDKKKIEAFIEGQSTLIENEILNTPIDKTNPLYSYYMKARKNDGAQVKFACGVIDFQRGKLDIYNAGDVHFLVYASDSEIDFYWNNDDGQVWSSKGNFDVNLTQHTRKIKDISRVSIASDGIREDFNKILDKKSSLRDWDLINDRFQVGEDDLSGIDIILTAPHNSDQLLKINDVEVNNKHVLTWAHVPHAERYRIYYSTGSSVQYMAEIDADKKSYTIPENLENGVFSIQAISSHMVSSEISDPITYNSTISQIPVKIQDERVKPGVYVVPHHKKDPTSTSPDFQPSRGWKRIAIGVAIVIIGGLIFSILKYSSIMDVLENKTATPSGVPNIKLSPTSNSEIERTVTPFCSPTPLVLSPTSTPISPTPLEVSNATPNSTPSPNPSDVDLTNCQRKTLRDEPGNWIKYQIQRGDTFSQLSRTYKISIEDLMRVNCYQTTELYANEYLLVPFFE